MNILVIVCEQDLYKQTEFIAQRASDYLHQSVMGSIKKLVLGIQVGVKDYKMYLQVSCFIRVYCTA